MKKTEPLEQNRVRSPRSGGVGKKTAPVKGVKPAPARRVEPLALLEEESRDSETCPVRFEYFHPLAREILVAGTFNGWHPPATPMAELRDGRWFAEVQLPPGVHEYRFVVDGEWLDDPMAARFVANSFGGLNCVVEV